jgi:hypothetical protein
MPKKRKKAAKKTKRKAAKKKLRKKQKRLKKLRKEKDSNYLIFTKNASHYNSCERRFFYSSKGSSLSEIGSSVGNSLLEVLVASTCGAACPTKFLFNALSSFF